jgi:hypothetical protein
VFAQRRALSFSLDKPTLTLPSSSRLCWLRLHEPFFGDLCALLPYLSGRSRQHQLLTCPQLPSKMSQIHYHHYHHPAPPTNESPSQSPPRSTPPVRATTTRSTI